MKLIYDSERVGGERLYVETPDGQKIFFPFYKIKFSDGFRNTGIDCWPSSKAQDAYIKKQQEKRLAEK
jgi:hypothetical protein